MKFYQVAFVLGLTVAASVQAAQPAKAAPSTGSFSREYGMAGCGLGSMVIGKENDFTQVFAATTNGTLYNQGFGITFGTANCDGGNLFNKAENMDQFINGNKVALASDIARGQGESIVSLASILECEGSGDELATQLNRNFREIFPSHTVHTMDVTDQIITVVSRNERLAKACNVAM